MNTLTKHFLCTLKEDLKDVDYSKWERSKPTTESKPVQWSSALPHHKGAKALRGTITARDIQTNASSNQIKQAPSENSGRSQANTTMKSSAAHSRPPQRMKTDKKEKNSPFLHENTETIKFLGQLKRRSVEVLENHCEVLQETNQQVAREIEDTDRGSVSSARDFLIQHEKMGNYICAFNRWSDCQIRQTKAELQDAVDEAENHLSGLKAQLKAVNARLMNAQAQLHTLKTYEDEEFPVKALQTAEMKGDLDKLKEAQQNEYEDVKLLCRREMARLESEHHQQKQDVLSAIAEENVSHIPPGIKLMALHNQTMKKEIDMHKNEILKMEDKNGKLVKSIQKLQLSRPNINREVFPDVFLKTDKSPTDMDVHLSIPTAGWLPI
ncbi:uncharacterized protein C20orf96 homolog [Hoplias malabaricus]|uniref:uncharacterized protein C20orf96 homolog n=1 Tax=Hoplias malabaricus TaxID=27720 RepID=UPI0034621454